MRADPTGRSARIRRSERGAGRFGCFVMLLVIGVFAYGCVKVFPVYLDKINFDEGLARLASKAGVENWSEKTAKERVMDLARSRGFQTTPEEIIVQRPVRFEPNPEIKISVKYRYPVEFIGYSHVFEFETRVSSFIGRL